VIHAETDDAAFCRRRDKYFFFKVGTNVSITKTAPATIKPGETLTYQLTYAVSGAAGAKVDNVVVRDTLPPHVTYVSASPTPSSVSGSTLFWNLGSRTTGARGTITLQVQLNIATQLTSLSNTGIVSTSTPGDDPSDNSSTVTTQVIAVPDVTVQKTAPAYTLPNAMLTYRLHYANIGTRLAKNVTVVDRLPNSGVQFFSASVDPSSRSGQTLTWNLGDLPFGESGDIMVTVQVTDNAPTSLTNRASISTTTPGDDPSNNTSTVTTAVVRPPAIGSDFKLQIHSTFDPKDGVYVSTGDTIAWPAGEVLDFTPKITLNYAGSTPNDPFRYNVRVTAWRFVSSLGKDAESDPAGQSRRHAQRRDRVELRGAGGEGHDPGVGRRHRSHARRTAREAQARRRTRAAARHDDHHARRGFRGDQSR
jgi:uncharacterized repeat protein (TIGR01451 family)